MTTESKQVTRPGAAVLLGAATAGLGLVLAATVAGGLVAGAAGMLGAAVGGSMALGVFVAGTVVVHVVSQSMPTASLLVALLTYTLQVVLMGTGAVALSRSGVIVDEVSRGWFAGSIIAVTATWIVMQVWLSSRQRIPVYDLPAGAPTGGER